MTHQKAAHRGSQTTCHIGWVTRYRRKILANGVAHSLRVVLQEVGKFYPDWFIEKLGIEADHVHLHRVIPSPQIVGVPCDAYREKCHEHQT